MDTEKLNEILEGLQPRLEQIAVEQFTSQLKYALDRELANTISKMVSDFVKDEIVPDVREQLTGKKGAIIAAAVMSAESLATMLAESMAKKVAANLNGYQRDEILKALFK